MKFNNHFLYNLKKNNLLFISSLIIIIFFSLYINSHFKEGNENMKTDESGETYESLQKKINEEKEKILTDEEKGNDEKISLDDFLSGDEGNRKKGIYNQIIAYKTQQNDLMAPIETLEKNMKENKTSSAIEINKNLLDVVEQISQCNFTNKLSKILGLNPGMMGKASQYTDKASSMAPDIKNPFSDGDKTDDDSDKDGGGLFG